MTNQPDKLMALLILLSMYLLALAGILLASEREKALEESLREMVVASAAMNANNFLLQWRREFRI